LCHNGTHPTKRDTKTQTLNGAAGEMPLTTEWLGSDSDVVGVFLLIVNRRPPLVGVNAGHFDDDDDGTSADETSALVEG